MDLDEMIHDLLGRSVEQLDPIDDLVPYVVQEGRRRHRARLAAGGSALGIAAAGAALVLVPALADHVLGSGSNGVGGALSAKQHVAVVLQSLIPLPGAGVRATSAAVGSYQLDLPAGGTPQPEGLAGGAVPLTFRTDSIPAGEPTVPVCPAGAGVAPEVPSCVTGQLPGGGLIGGSHVLDAGGEVEATLRTHYHGVNVTLVLFGGAANQVTDPELVQLGTSPAFLSVVDYSIDHGLVDSPLVATPS